METTEHTNRKPRILATDEQVGDLDTFDAVEVKGRNLKEGMILLPAKDDGLNFAEAVMDHRMRADRNSGAAKWMIANIESGHGRYSEVNFHLNATYRVAAR